MKKNLVLLATLATMTFSGATFANENLNMNKKLAIEANMQKLDQRLLALEEMKKGFELQEMEQLEAELSFATGMDQKSIKGCCSLGDLNPVRIAENVVREGGRAMGNVSREATRAYENVRREVDNGASILNNVVREAERAARKLTELANQILMIDQITKEIVEVVKKHAKDIEVATGNIVRETGSAAQKANVVILQVSQMGQKGIDAILFSKVVTAVLPDDLIEVAKIGTDSLQILIKTSVLATNEAMRISKFPGYIHDKAFNLCLMGSVVDDFDSFVRAEDSERKERLKQCFDASLVSFDPNAPLDPNHPDYARLLKEKTEQEARIAREKAELEASIEAQKEKARIMREKEEEKKRIQEKVARLKQLKEKLEQVGKEALDIQTETNEILGDLGIDEE